MKDYTHYNDRVNSATAERLLDINRRFYSERGRDFSETRERVQPGVRRILESLGGDESILDLGCGNGSFARELSRRGHRGQYLGMDFSAPLLEHARRARYSLPTRFVQSDLVPRALASSVIDSTLASSPSHDSVPSNIEGWSGGTDLWSVVTSFAVLHHIPGRDRRLALLALVRGWLQTGGIFVHSSWQFSASPRLQARIQPWSSVGLEAHELDEGDYLMDWRRGGSGLRYVHEFHEDELADLASESGFVVAETFYSDGADRKSGLYQVWRPA
ncbi:MAG: methyltransferase domain-containing protein [Chloroflexota bacterium]